MVDFVSSDRPPLISIIIPCWNAECYVGEAIESALAQTYLNVEVIVIDDGSTDSSLEVIKSFGDRIRWETGPNQGGCAARNRGLSLAKGDLIQFLDADDVLLPHKLALQVPHALAAGPERLSLCFGKTDCGDAFLDWQYARHYNHLRDPVDFLVRGIVQTSAPLHFRKNLLKQGGFDENLPCAQEWDLHLRLICAGLGIAQLCEVLFVVCRQPNSVSSDSLKVLKQHRYIIDKAASLLRATGDLTAARSRSLGVALAGSALALELGGLQEEALACRREAQQLCPDAIALAWTPRWRPLVRLFGPGRVARLRRWLKTR